MFREKEYVGSTAAFRDEFQPMITDKIHNPLARDLINSVDDEDGLNAGKYQFNYVPTNDDICRGANIYDIAGVEYFGSIWWGKG